MKSELDKINDKLNQTLESDKGTLMVDKNNNLNAKGKFEPTNEKSIVFTFNLQVEKYAMTEETKLNDTFELDGDYWFGKIEVTMPYILPVTVFNRLTMLTSDLILKVEILSQSLKDLYKANGIDFDNPKDSKKDVPQEVFLEWMSQVDVKTLELIKEFNKRFFDLKDNIYDRIIEHQMIIFFDIVDAYPDLFKSVLSFLARQNGQNKKTK